jgi:hypothetical protein
MAREEQGLSSANRDFSLRWHLICASAVAVTLLIAYVTAKKLIFG